MTPDLKTRPRMRRSDVELADDVERVPLTLVNAYMIGPSGAADREWVMIDTGTRFGHHHITDAARKRFGDSRPAAIILTHGHFDHIGSISELAEMWDVPIYCHPLELPYLDGRSGYPAPDPWVGGGAISWLSFLFPHGAVDIGPRLALLPPDGALPYLPDWQWLHTPGHSPGHISLFRESDGLLIAGDAFVTQAQESLIGVVAQQQRVRRPPAYYTIDWDAARESVAALLNLHPEVVATGHGIPMRGEVMRQQLATLVKHWEDLGRPAHGRYVHRPVVADDRGLRSVPQPIVNPKLVKAAALMVLVGAVIGAIRLFGKR